ncbi:MAG: histidine phosphatase family protein [Chloroflexi bacterium]|nr:histidine phosphatase family protein [Chloroflexota bacterium]
MDLYLVRHAAAFDPDPTQWPSDRERPLTPEGEKRFRRAARGLASLVASVDVVLSSSYRRAWRTAELLSAAGWPAPVQCEALEGGRSSTEVLQALQAHSASSSVALVGHEPTMHELVSYLLTADTRHAQVEFGKGAVARLALDGLRPGSARLRWLLAPKVLRAIAG